jgi:CHRD domain-containing protein
MSKAAFIVIAGLCFAACSSDAPKPTAPFSVPVFESSDKSDNANGGNFGTPLTSAEEPVPANVHESNARGNAIFHLNDAGTELEYKLIVANIDNVFQAHIHIAQPGVNGPIVVWLYPSTAPVAGPLGKGRIEGVIAEGTITAANVLSPTQLPGYNFARLLNDLRTGGAYVNVHTNDGIAPTNTGPGDFPGGEVRGQVEHRGH